MAAVKAAGGKSVEGKKLLDGMTKLTDEFKRRTDKLREGARARRQRRRRRSTPSTSATRSSRRWRRCANAGDELELIIPHELWPLATYREMLFIK